MGGLMYAYQTDHAVRAAGSSHLQSGRFGPGTFKNNVGPVSIGGLTDLLGQVCFLGVDRVKAQLGGHLQSGLIKVGDDDAGGSAVLGYHTH